MSEILEYLLYFLGTGMPIPLLIHVLFFCECGSNYNDVPRRFSHTSQPFSVNSDQTSIFHVQSNFTSVFFSSYISCISYRFHGAVKRKHNAKICLK